MIFTISPEFKPLFEAALEEVKAAYEKKYGVKYNISFTFQDKATDTVAVDKDNNLSARRTASFCSACRPWRIDL